MEQNNIISNEETNPSLFEYTESEFIHIKRYIGHEANVIIPKYINNKMVKCIDSGAFSDCDSILSVVIDGIEEIACKAFSNCKNLASVTIGKSVTKIEDDAFLDCKTLVEIINKSSLNITKGSSDNGNVGLYALRIKDKKTKYTIGIVKFNDFLFYKYNSENYLIKYLGNDTDVELPIKYDDKKYRIHDYAFYNCFNLTSISMMAYITRIGDEAFFGCKNLVKVELSNIVESIGNSAFANCTNLTKVKFGHQLKTIGPKAFYNCSKLKSIIIPGEVNSVGANAFYNCCSLKDIIIINSEYTRIADNAFLGCARSLTTSTEWYYEFKNNKKRLGATDIKLKYLYYIDDYIFASCDMYSSTFQYKNANFLIKYVGDDQKLVLPSDPSTDETYEIYDYAFYENDNITSVVIPNIVTSIGAEAFSRCRNLKNIEIPNSVKIIKYATFLSCTSLTSVIIPDSVVSIGPSAFNNCVNLKNIVIPNSVTSIGASAFNRCPIPMQEYDNAYYIGTIDNPYMSLVKAKSTEITSCTINERCTTISSSAFFRCTFLENVTIPNTVTSIGGSAFSECNNLTNITIPNGVTYIGVRAFAYSGLTSVTIGNSVKSISSEAFTHNNLKSIILPKSINNIDYDAFEFNDESFTIYYQGTLNEWEHFACLIFYCNQIKKKVKYYSEDKPNSNENQYWHYVDGMPVIWD